MSREHFTMTSTLDSAIEWLAGLYAYVGAAVVLCTAVTVWPIEECSGVEQLVEKGSAWRVLGSCWTSMGQAAVYKLAILQLICRFFQQIPEVSVPMMIMMYFCMHDLHIKQAMWWLDHQSKHKLCFDMRTPFGSRCAHGRIYWTNAAYIHILQHLNMLRGLPYVGKYMHIHCMPSLACSKWSLRTIRCVMPWWTQRLLKQLR